MALAEGVQATIVYKRYASGAIATDTQDQAPGASGAQVLRRVSSSLALVKPTYRSQEIRADRQIVDHRHGNGTITGDIAGEISPSTYFDFFESCHRDTRVDEFTIDESDVTSLAASNSGSTLTCASGDPVALGLFVGDIIRLTDMTVSGNNDTNFLITGFSGTSNRVIAVTPAPTDETADTSFTLTRVGAATIVPASSHVSYKYGIEARHDDLDVSRLFTEVRLSKYSMSLPATGMGTVTFGVLGRGQVLETGAGSPYFTSPTAETSTGIVAAVNGKLLVDGAVSGIIAGITINYEMAASDAMRVGSNFTGEIFLGTSAVSGQLTAYIEDATFLTLFANETEFAILLELTTTSAVNTDAITVYLPRVKLSSAGVNLAGEGGQMIQADFQALRYVGTGPGIPTTTIRIVDTTA